MNVREIKLQENGLFSRLVLELGDRLVRFLGAACCEVNLRVVHKELLRGSNQHNVKKLVGARGLTHLYSFLSDTSVTTW